MQEMKTPKKPLIFYYVIAMIVLLLINFLVYPSLMQRQVQDVDYSTFLQMLDNKEVGYVDITDTQITFTDKDQQNVYRTGVMDDIQLVNRLYESGAQFSKEIVQEASPIVSFPCGLCAAYCGDCGGRPVYDEKK